MKKVTLAVESRVRDDGIQRRILEQVEIFLAGSKSEVEPVHVLHGDFTRIGTGLEMNEIRDWAREARESIGRMLQAHRFPRLLEPKVLEVMEPSGTACVKALNAYAKASGSDLIIVGSYGRSGVPRLFLGSFSETLLLHAEIPVLVVGPQSESGSKLERILFATDFSQSSEKVFEQVLVQAAALGAAVTVFHAIPHRFVSPMEIEGISVDRPMPALLQQLTEECRRRARILSNVASSRGVEADILVEVAEGGVDQSVLNAASRIQAGQVVMIAMAATSGAVSSAILGSVTRQVVRSASCPVWVLRQR